MPHKPDQRQAYRRNDCQENNPEVSLQIEFDKIHEVDIVLSFPPGPLIFYSGRIVMSLCLERPRQPEASEGIVRLRA